MSNILEAASAWREAFDTFAAGRDFAESAGIALAERRARDLSSIDVDALEESARHADARASAAFQECGRISTQALAITPATPAECRALFDMRKAHLLAALRSVAGKSAQYTMVEDALDRTLADFEALLPQGVQ